VPLRILHILDHSIPLHSGYSFRTIALLTEQRRMGWETFHLTTPRQGPSEEDKETVDGWTFYRTPLEKKNGALNAYLREMSATHTRIEELIQHLQPHVLHAHSPVLNVLPALRARRRTRIPVVYELRASWEDAAVSHGTTAEGSVRYKLSRALETWALRRADAVATICDGLRRDILSRGVPAEKIAVVPNAVDVNAFQYEPAAEPELRRSLGLEGATVLGFAGSFYGYEGLDLLLDAFAQLVADRAELRLLLIGSGPEEERLRERASSLHLTDKVVFTGAVPHSAMPRYYAQIDLVCYPRKPMRLTDLVTPLKPLEAMAHGKVLVASDVKGHQELIRDGETGVLFRAGDVSSLIGEIERLLSSRADWERIARAARTFVERERNWAVSAANYKSLYRFALANRADRHIEDVIST
jgi:glycogen(starch) synthase